MRYDFFTFLQYDPQHLEEAASCLSFLSSSPFDEDLTSDVESFSASASPASPASTALKPPSVIAQCRRLGKDSLQQLKVSVSEFASCGHTYKETAKRFGIHHSTVSGWVKEQQRQSDEAKVEVNVEDNATTSEDKFVGWLMEARKLEMPLNASLVRRKAKECLNNEPDSNWLKRWLKR